jgi:hypothetical protein
MPSRAERTRRIARISKVADAILAGRLVLFDRPSPNGDRTCVDERVYNFGGRLSLGKPGAETNGVVARRSDMGRKRALRVERLMGATLGGSARRAQTRRLL